MRTSEAYRESVDATPGGLLLHNAAIVRVPEDFLLGVSTSSYQIEGGVHEGGRGPSIWDAFCAKTGRVRGGDSGDVACDHYGRWREDLDLLSDLGAQVYRFSIAWPRVIPDGSGQLNTTGLDFYDRLVDELLERGIEPWPCLYHWDLPLALERRGGWRSRDIVGWFTDYAVRTTVKLGDRVPKIALLNEPGIFVVMGHLAGVHAPGSRSFDATIAAAHHANLATASAGRALRELLPELQIGTVLALNRFEPASDRAEDRDACQRMVAFMNDAFLDPLLGRGYPEVVADAFSGVQKDGDDEAIACPLDFLGVNHYTRVLVESRSKARLFGAGLLEPPKGRPRTAMGWEIHPRGLYDVLRETSEKAPDVPLFVTENGAAFADAVSPEGEVVDQERIDFIKSYLEQALEARASGVDLRGYLLWTLLDNFEWAEGYAKHFGIVRCGPDALDRRPKASFHWYRSLAESREL